MKKEKASKEPKWQYGHRREIGEDGKPTGRTVSYRRDRNTGKVEKEMHKHFPPKR